MRRTCVTLTVLLTAAAAMAQGAATMKVEQLRCEYLKDPVGIEAAQPRLSWQLASDARGTRQTGYRVLVASDVDKLSKDTGDLWDSGRVESGQSTQVAYAGKELASGQQVFWKVMVWDEKSKASDWSEVATWTMGLRTPADWKAKWIGYDARPAEADLVRTKIPGPKGKGKTKTYLPCPRLRKPFEVAGKVRRAVLYVSAQGVVQMRLNGSRVGDEYLTPGWTDYRKRIYYRAYDVTKMLKAGENCLGAILGDGWFRGNISVLGQDKYGKTLRLLAQLRIELADGSVQTVASDKTWAASFGPIRQSDMQSGETYDARLETPGWDAPGFDAAGWAAVDTGSEIQPRIEPYPGEPVRRVAELKTQTLTQPKPGVWVFDLGQNFAGFARLRVNQPAGTKITMRFAEMLEKDGTVYTENLRSARATDTYICKGGGEEIWEPHFVFHGFRYVQVTGLEGKAEPDMIAGVALSSDCPPAGAFECSAPLLNQLYSNIVWGQRSNYLEVPTDCPQRDERLGWTGDTQVFMRTGTYNADVSAFFTKWIVDLMDTQDAKGSFGNQAPVFHGHGSPGWADAGIICPWTMYQIYGDKRILRNCYDAMAKYLEHYGAKGLSGPGGGFGDWLAVGSKTPKELISAAYYAHDTRMMAQIADVLGKDADAKKYRDQLAAIRENFQKKFVKLDGTLEGDSQTDYCLAITFDLLAPAQREKAAARLVERVKAKDNHISVGFLGVPIILPTLTEIGRSDLATRLILNKTYPSWGYSIEQGATTIWERWNSYTKDGGFASAGMNSFNHYAYGSCGEWMFRSLLGIDAGSPGFGEIVMTPQPSGQITWARGHYDSIHGRIVSDWKLAGGRFTWDVTIPANTTATLRIPAGAVEQVTESGKALSKADGVTVVGMEAGRAVVKVAAGRYHFEAEPGAAK